mmetsp:Transcript_83222/g.199726  ORF Transcript_83222/g.199726 Transcript_83222/m.199726 type:complete len:213 (+) Transcript_83222:1405-2043(+)
MAFKFPWGKGGSSGNVRPKGPIEPGVSWERSEKPVRPNSGVASGERALAGRCPGGAGPCGGFGSCGGRAGGCGRPLVDPEDWLSCRTGITGSCRLCSARGPTLGSGGRTLPTAGLRGYLNGFGLACSLRGIGCAGIDLGGGFASILDCGSHSKQNSKNWTMGNTSTAATRPLAPHALSTLIASSECCSTARASVAKMATMKMPARRTRVSFK